MLRVKLPYVVLVPGATLFTIPFRASVQDTLIFIHSNYKQSNTSVKYTFGIR